MRVEIKQHDEMDCGAACICSVAAFYNLHIPIAKAREIIKTDRSGTSMYGLLQGALKLQFEAKGVSIDYQDLKKVPTPFIAHVVLENQLHHYLVVYHSNQKRIKAMDPKYGKFVYLNSEYFNQIWSGASLLLVPSEKFVARKLGKSNFARLFEMILIHRSVLTQILFGSIIYTLLGLSTSIYIQKLHDFVFASGNYNMLNLLSILLLVVFLFQLFISYIKSKLSLQTAQIIDAQIILNYYRHLLRLPQSFFDSMKVGEIVSRINDAFKIRVFVNDVLVSIVMNIFILLSSFALMFVYNPKLAFAISLSIPLYALLYFIVNRLNKKTERKLMVKYAELESQLIESLNSVLTLKIFSLEKHSNLKTEIAFTKLLDQVYASGKNSIINSSASDSMSKAMVLTLLWFGGSLVLSTEITAGELMSFYALLAYISGPVNSLLASNKIIQSAAIASDRLFEIMELEVTSEDESKIRIPDLEFEYLKFVNVNFSYGNRGKTLNNVCLSVSKGDFYAIIGESGSGKSTISMLSKAIYKPDDGKIEINGVEIKFINNDDLNKLITIVPQQIDLLEGSILENITLEFDQSKIDYKRLIEICKKINLFDFVMSLPEGFNSSLRANGSNLSGGQKQKLAIARAIYKNSQIIILDEATSSLDIESELAVIDYIKYLNQTGKTIIIITHKIKIANAANRILVIQNGEIKEEGNRTELLERKTIYYNLNKLNY